MDTSVHQNPRLSDTTGNATTSLTPVPLPPIKGGVLRSSLPQRVNGRSLGSFWTLRVNGTRHVWTAQTSREPVTTMRKRPKLSESGGGPRDACQRVWWEQVFVTGIVAIVDTTRGFTRELVRVRVRFVITEANSRTGLGDRPYWFLRVPERECLLPGAQDPYIRSGWHAAEGAEGASTPDTPSCRCCCCCCCSMGCSCRSRSCSCSCCCGRNCSCRSWWGLQLELQWRLQLLLLVLL